MLRFDRLITPAVQRRMIEVAREFRKEPTESEATLWAALRNRALDRYKFRRQQPVGPFVVDFYCDAASLVVEVDGPVHERLRAADSERQRLLEAVDLRVLRVRAADVVEDLDAVLRTISTALDQQVPPLPRGEGVRG